MSGEHFEYITTRNTF